MKIECHKCKVPVDATVVGECADGGFDSIKTYLLQCTDCKSAIVGESTELFIKGKANIIGEEPWTEPIRVYPSPRRHLGNNIPKAAHPFINDAERCLEAGANLATIAMCERAIEIILSVYREKNNYLDDKLKNILNNSIIGTSISGSGSTISAETATTAVMLTYALANYVSLLTNKSDPHQKAR